MTAFSKRYRIQFHLKQQGYNQDTVRKDISIKGVSGQRSGKMEDEIKDQEAKTFCLSSVKEEGLSHRSDSDRHAGDLNTRKLKWGHWFRGRPTTVEDTYRRQNSKWNREGKAAKVPIHPFPENSAFVAFLAINVYLSRGSPWSFAMARIVFKLL